MNQFPLALTSGQSQKTRTMAIRPNLGREIVALIISYHQSDQIPVEVGKPELIQCFEKNRQSHSDYSLTSDLKKILKE